MSSARLGSTDRMSMYAIRFLSCLSGFACNAISSESSFDDFMVVSGGATPAPSSPGSADSVTRRRSCGGDPADDLSRASTRCRSASTSAAVFGDVCLPSLEGSCPS